jgi:hypothetical protein
MQWKFSIDVFSASIFIPVKNGSCVLLSQPNQDVTQQLGRLSSVRGVSASTSSWYKGIVYHFQLLVGRNYDFPRSQCEGQLHKKRTNCS